MPRTKLPFKNFEWTSNLAYAVGLLVTDGCLSKDGRHIVMRSAEPQLLEAFKECIDTKSEIHKQIGKNISYKVQVGNIQLYNWLTEIGLFSAKTYTIGEIKIPDNFFRDFLRGHLDGDGSVQVYLDKYNIYKGRQYSNNRLFVRFISASEIHMKWLHSKIKTLAMVNGSLLKKVDKTGYRVPIWEIKFSKKESIRLLKWIYYQENLPTLLRKRLVAENAMDKILSEKRKIYTKI